MSIGQTYKIETERLIIRCYEPADANMLLNAITISVEHLIPWMPWAKDEPAPLDDVINRLRYFRGQFDLGNDYIFGIFNKSENELIGGTGLHTRIGKGAGEIGYWISAKHINKGYATETVCALTKVGFEIEQLSRIEIHCAPDNIRSQNIPKKLGYTHEATLRKRTVDTDGNPRDTMIWTMFKEEYENSRIKATAIKAFDIVGRKIPL